MNEKDIKFHILNKSSVYIEQKHTKYIKLKKLVGTETVCQNKLYDKNKKICNINQIVAIQIEI